MIENLGINVSNDLAVLRAVIVLIQNFNLNTDKNLFLIFFSMEIESQKFEIFKNLYSLIKKK